MGRSEAPRCRASSLRTTSSTPTRITLTSSTRAARIAPSTSDLGAWSPPMASTAMVSMGDSGRLLFDDLDHFAALVFAAMRAHAVRQLRLVAIGAFRQPTAFQGVVRPARGGALFRMSAFWIRHTMVSFFPLVLNTLKRRPTVVRGFRLALALLQVPVLPAYRTNPFAPRPAQPLDRQRKQHKLAQYVVQLHAVAFVKSHLGFARVEHLLLAQPFGHRPVVQLKVPVDRAIRRLQTTIAIGLHPHRHMPLNPDLLQEIADQLRLPDGPQRADLVQLQVGKLDRTRSQLHIEGRGAELQVSNVKEHACSGPDRLSP